MLHYVFRLKNEDGMKIATSYDTNEYLSFQIGAKDVITGELEWVAVDIGSILMLLACHKKISKLEISNFQAAVSVLFGCLSFVC